MDCEFSPPVAGQRRDTMNKRINILSGINIRCQHDRNYNEPCSECDDELAKYKTIGVRPSSPDDVATLSTANAALEATIATQADKIDRLEKVSAEYEKWYLDRSKEYLIATQAAQLKVMASVVIEAHEDLYPYQHEFSCKSVPTEH